MSATPPTNANGIFPAPQTPLRELAFLILFTNIGYKITTFFRNYQIFLRFFAKLHKNTRNYLFFYIMVNPTY